MKEWFPRASREVASGSRYVVQGGRRLAEDEETRVLGRHAARTLDDKFLLPLDANEPSREAVERREEVNPEAGAGGGGTPRLRHRGRHRGADAWSRMGVDTSTNARRFLPSAPRRRPLQNGR